MNLPVAHLLLWLGCAPETPAKTQVMGSEFSVTTTIMLEENASSLLVGPMVSGDPRGGFLVAEPAESQVRRYSETGKLIWSQGREGGGPGEFRRPMFVLRAPSGELVAVERGGRLTWYTEAGDSVLETQITGIGNVQGALVLSDSTLLINGIRSNDVHGAKLHVWNRARGETIHSFFSRSFQSDAELLLQATWVHVARQDDTLAVVYAPSDTVYFVTLTGQPVRQVPLASERIRIAGAVPLQDRGSTQSVSRWMAHVHFVQDVHWMRGGHLIVQYKTVAPPDTRWYLLGMTTDGVRTFEYEDTPRLLTSLPETDAVVFVHPSSEVPNKWVVATVRR